MGVRLFDLENRAAMEEMSRDRTRGDYSAGSLRRRPLTPHRSFLRSLVNTNSVEHLTTMVGNIRDNLDPSYDFKVGIGRTGDYEEGFLIPFKPTHFVSSTEFDADLLEISGSHQLKARGDYLKSIGYRFRILGPIFIHDLHNYILGSFLADTSRTQNKIIHNIERERVGVRMLQRHLRETSDYPVTVVAMPVRKVNENPYDSKDLDISVTHRMFLRTAGDFEQVYYDELDVGNTKYGLYYLSYGDLLNFRLRSLLFHDSHHKELFRQSLGVWNANFRREISLVSGKQRDIGQKHIDEMIKETVTNYRRLFKVIDAARTVRQKEIDRRDMQRIIEFSSPLKTN